MLWRNLLKKIYPIIFMIIPLIQSDQFSQKHMLTSPTTQPKIFNGTLMAPNKNTLQMTHFISRHKYLKHHCAISMENPCQALNRARKFERPRTKRTRSNENKTLETHIS